MTGKRDSHSFEDSKKLALQGIASMERHLEEAAVLIASTKYSVPDLVAPRYVRDLLKRAAIELEMTRRNFERSRWAADRTDLEFESWLADKGWSDRRLTHGALATARDDKAESPVAGAKRKRDAGAAPGHR